MITEDATELRSFFATADFAQDAIWTPDGGAAATVQVIFAAEYFETRAGAANVAGLQPGCAVAASQVIGITRADTLQIGLDTYTVIDAEPDGTGLMQLSLQGPLPAPGGFELEDGSGAILLETGDKLETE